MSNMYLKLPPTNGPETQIGAQHMPVQRSPIRRFGYWEFQGKPDRCLADGVEMVQIKGGCFCGAIRYEFDRGDYTITNCHCSMCRKTSGAPYVTWVVVPKGAFSYSSGSPAELQSSETGTRYFCNKCGTPVVCVSSKHPEIVDVTAGSLDHPEDFRPTMESFEDSRLPWTRD